MSLITLDQAIAGASNVFTALLAARVLGVAAFGFFGIVFLVYVMAQGVSRALVCDPLLVHTGETHVRRREIVGTSAVLGTGLGVVVIAAGAGVTLLQPELGQSLMVLGACLPLLVFQDLGRYLGFSDGRPGTALVLDVVWLVLVFVTSVALLVTGTRTLLAFIVAWAVSGAASGLLIFRLHRTGRVRPSLSWLRYTWRFSWRYLISYSSTQGAALAGSSAIGALAGPRSLGGVQGSILLSRPFATFQVAAVASSVAEMSRARTTGNRLRRGALRTSALTTAVAVVNGAIMVLLPAGLGRLLLGDSWAAAQPLMLATAAQLLALGVITGARSALLALRAVNSTAIIDVVTTVLVLIATMTGAAVDGALGALWAVASAQAVAGLVWWRVLWMRTRETEPTVRRPRPTPDGAPSPRPQPGAGRRPLPVPPSTVNVLP